MPKIKNFRKPPELPQLEEEIMKFWKINKIFEKSVEQRNKDNSYVFYDGPPFATGLPHYGHLLGSTSKDVIPRYQTMKGKKVARVWGWDCHGLPIENMIEKNLDIKGGRRGIEKLGIDKFNQACRNEVLRLDKAWEKIIGRLGRWVDFKNNYKTMDKSYMESVWWGFKQLYDKDLIYQGKKVILYCPRCATPLSNFEIAMDNSYKNVIGPSTIYKFKLKKAAKTYFLAWSTTPWNKIVTPALAVNPHLTYLKVKQNNEFYILAESSTKILGVQPYEVISQYQGKDLEQYEYELHYDFFAEERKPGEKVGIIIADDFVTSEEGTGIVTLAVYGEDDWRVMNERGVQLMEHIDEEGKIKPQVEPWAGLYIKKADPLVNEDLLKRGLIYHDEKAAHNAPVCYRCGTQLYYAPLPAWFVDIQKLKKNLIEQNEKISWFPKHLKHGRFMKGLENAPDWNISRSRYWGTPMPIWRAIDQNGQEKLRIIGSIEELKKWAAKPALVDKLNDIHREFLDDLEVWVDDTKTFKGQRVKEVFDCWVESGSMSFASVHYPFENKDNFEKNYPAQFISEYIAQTRAWFYTMHVLSVGIFGKPSFENVLTTGTILAEDGSKMSKSLKNYPDPMCLINQYGVDSLRLYLMSSTVMKSENMNFSEREVADIRRNVFVIWWNVLAFYQLFADKDHDVQVRPAKVKHQLDRWILSKLHSLIKDVTHFMDTYDVIRASRSLMSFVNELSTWYLRLSRDRLKTENNQQVSHILGHVLYVLAQLFAPICPFFAELVHHNLVNANTSIHLSNWPEVDKLVIDSRLETEMDKAKSIVEQAHSLRKEKAIKLRQPLVSLTIFISKKLENQEALSAIIAGEVNVKKVIWQIEQVEENDDQLQVDFDFSITSDLEAEGQAREIVRKIQNLRRKTGLAVNDQVKVKLPDWPKKWQDFIERKTNTRLQEGDNIELIG